MHVFRLKLLMAAALALAIIGCQPNRVTESDESPSQSAGQAEAAHEVNGLAASLENSSANQKRTEAQRMLDAIARGRLGPGEGWFGPGQSRYSWNWLAAVQGLKGATRIAEKQFHANPLWFERLDRNRDGQLEAADLDWSDGSRYVMEYNVANRLLAKMDEQEDGRLTLAEWKALFKNAARDRQYVTTVDLAELLLASQAGDFLRQDMRDPEMLIHALSRGEMGSPSEGPSLNAPAPDFELKTYDGERTIRLSDLYGSKPIVLVFGNFTCGPFRTAYPMVEDLKQRYQEDAEFVAVYVRETHPSDGWRTESNARLGLEIAQPTTYEERVAAARQCQAALKFSMPLVVDTIDDEVAIKFSGIPTRLYVIDRDGRVSYKSGRGPFGFKTGEMEQALLLTLIEQQAQTAPLNQ